VNPTATAALIAAAVIAPIDWFAVGARRKPLEYVAKPATTLALIAAAATLDPASSAQRWAFVAGLVLSLAGDVALMLPGDRFVAGVGSFFCAHVAYIIGFRIGPTSALGLVAGVAVVGVFVMTIGMRVLASVRERESAFLTPVTAYIAVIAVMVACAVSAGDPVAIAGAGIFMLSDTLIAWNRFVQPLAWAPVAIMITYHVGQAALVLALAT
jgi:uncharacterized membrane protein YhhN